MATAKAYTDTLNKYFGGNTAAYAAELKRKEAAGLAPTNADAAYAFRTDYADLFAPSSGAGSGDVGGIAGTGAVGGGGAGGDGDTVKPEVPVYPDMTAKIEDLYLNQHNSLLAALQASRQAASAPLYSQLGTVPAEYRAKKNEADVRNILSADRIREAMAANGIRGGQNISTQAALETARGAALNNLSLQEEQDMNDIRSKIAAIYNSGDEKRIASEVAAARAEALLNAERDRYNQQYQQYRDTVGDTRYADERDYTRGWNEDERTYVRGRDAVADTRYADETAYNRGVQSEQFAYQKYRDSVSDQQYADAQAYQKERDGVADTQYYDEVAWAKNPDNPAYRAQILANQIAELELKNLPERYRLELEQMRKSNAQIGMTGGGGSGAAQAADKARLSIMKTASSMAQEQMQRLYPNDAKGKNPLSVEQYTAEQNRWFEYYMNQLSGGSAAGAEEDLSLDDYLS